jgi:L-iditol 2-dehydrogenase
VKALLLSAPGRLEYVDYADPSMAPGEVLVRIKACSICGSDFHGMDGSSGRRIPPLIMGHEAAGTVASVGAEVKGWQPGDRVTFDSTIYCGQCPYCRAGEVNLCDQRQVLGVSCADYRRNGAFAEFVAVPAYLLYRLPDTVSFVEAAIVEPLAVACHAVSRAVVTAESSVVVIGCGVIGLLILQVLRASGCARVIAVDVNSAQLERARRMGASDTVNSGSGDASSEILARIGARGADLVFEAVGMGVTVDLAAGVAAKGGHVVLVGNLEPHVKLPLQAVVTRQLTMAGSAASSGEYPRCLEMIDKRLVDVRSVVSAVAPLAKGPEWFRRLRSGEGDLLRVVLEP